VAHFIHSSGPWFVRGTHFVNGLDAGAFAFGNADSRADNTVSFRVVFIVLFFYL